jgi:hypothetical protein
VNRRKCLSYLSTSFAALLGSSVNASTGALGYLYEAYSYSEKFPYSCISTIKKTVQDSNLSLSDDRCHWVNNAKLLSLRDKYARNGLIADKIFTYEDEAQLTTVFMFRSYADFNNWTQEILPLIDTKKALQMGYKITRKLVSTRRIVLSHSVGRYKAASIYKRGSSGPLISLQKILS